MSPPLECRLDVLIGVPRGLGIRPVPEALEEDLGVPFPLHLLPVRGRAEALAPLLQILEAALEHCPRESLPGLAEGQFGHFIPLAESRRSR